MDLFVLYDFSQNNENIQSTNCLASLKKLANEAQNISTINEIVLCDNNPESHYEPIWNGILYTSGLACKRSNLNNKITLFQKKNGQTCICSKNKNDICIIRKAICDMTLKRF